MAEYKVQSVQPDMYLDAGGKPVRGYLVRVEFLDFGEILDIPVPNLDTETVRNAIENLLAQRQALAQLGV